jgi:hypothetical protein
VRLLAWGRGGPPQRDAFLQLDDLEAALPLGLADWRRLVLAARFHGLFRLTWFHGEAPSKMPRAQTERRGDAGCLASNIACLQVRRKRLIGSCQAIPKLLSVKTKKIGQPRDAFVCFLSIDQREIAL